MKVGLIDHDSKIPNLALMKISAYHKNNFDEVEFFQPLFNIKYDKVYSSKVFSATKSLYEPKTTIKGGSGFSLEKKLPYEMEHIYPDYSLYDCKYAMGFLTRGCINRCGFCIVPKKEGKLHRVAILDDFWKDQKEVLLLDNALTDYHAAVFDFIHIRDLGLRLNLSQGFNVRTIRPKMAKILAEIKLWKGKQWHIAWDNPKDEKRVFQGIDILNKAGIKNYRIMCYVLVGYNTSIKQDLDRIYKLQKLGLDPFVMKFKKTPELNKLARWCNRPQLRKSFDFKEYNRKK